MSDLSPARAVAAFDSASGFVRATAAALHGQRFRRLGQGRTQAAAVLAASILPRQLRTATYAISGGREGVPPDRLGDVDMEAVGKWIVDQYPRRCYPAVAIGSSNGALVHLCAALGIPWLPQTLLVPVRWPQSDPDDPGRSMEFGARVAGPLLDRNPNVALHHMHDANQDRLMVARMAYFRLKQLRLNRAYEEFLNTYLTPGGPVLLIDDRSRWPVSQVSDRHYFQTGAQGGVAAREYLRDGGAARTRVRPPTPDRHAAEAEWGFADPLRNSITSWAATHGHPVRHIAYPEPEALSAPIADLYRWAYRRQGLEAERLIVESFLLLDPVGVRLSRSVPFWTMFAVGPSLQRLSEYLDANSYAEIYATLFPHGTQSVGWAGPSEWSSRLGLARDRHGFLGVTERMQPADFAALVRFEPAVHRLVEQGPTPGALTMDDVDTWARESGTSLLISSAR
jgi:hypothetical protein